MADHEEVIRDLQRNMRTLSQAMNVLMLERQQQPPSRRNVDMEATKSEGRSLKVDEEYFKRQQKLHNSYGRLVSPIIQDLLACGLKDRARAMIDSYNAKTNDLLKLKRALKEKRRQERLQQAQERMQKAWGTTNLVVHEVYDNGEVLVELLDEKVELEVDQVVNFETTKCEHEEEAMSFEVVHEDIMVDKCVEEVVEKLVTKEVDVNQESSVEVQREKPKFRTFDTLFDPPKFFPKFQAVIKEDYDAAVIEEGKKFRATIHGEVDEVKRKFDLSFEFAGVKLNKIRGRIFPRKGGLHHVSWVHVLKLQVHGYSIEDRQAREGACGSIWVRKHGCVDQRSKKTSMLLRRLGWLEQEDVCAWVGKEVGEGSKLAQENASYAFCELEKDLVCFPSSTWCCFPSLISLAYFSRVRIYFLIFIKVVTKKGFSHEVFLSFFY